MTTASHPSDPSRIPVIVAWGVVSPIGIGRDPFALGLRSGRMGIRSEEFNGLGKIPVGRVEGLEHPRGVDRAMHFLETASRELRPAFQKLSRSVPPERRGVAAASSKGAFLLLVEDPQMAAANWQRLWACDPAVKLSQIFDCRGPRQSVVGACATGLGNLLRAAEWIRDGVADLAIVGSAEGSLHPLYLASFQNLGAMARHGSYPFDARHEGFIAGEGGATFLLTSQCCAAENGLKPIARISGWRTGSDAYHTVAIDVSGVNIAAVGDAAIKLSGLSEKSIDFVSCHGTATAANDTAESAALRRLFADGPPPLHAIKGVCGHLMGAAGAVETAAILAAFEGNFLPPNPSFETPAPGCEGLNLPREAADTEVRSALKWSFGFGGALVAAVFENGNFLPDQLSNGKTVLGH